MRMDARRRVAALALAALALAGAALALHSPAGHAEGTSNGIASKSPAAIVAAARSAVDGVSSVHVAGSGLEGGQTITLDLRLAAGRGGEGTLTLNGGTFQIVVIAKTVYFKGSAAFWRQSSGETAAKKLGGRWLKGPLSGELASVAAFGDIHKLFAQLLAPKGTLTEGAITKIRGQPAIGITDAANRGTLYVATTGRPYPLQINNSSKHGVIVIDQIGSPVTLTAPSGATDITQVGG